VTPGQRWLLIDLFVLTVVLTVIVAVIWYVTR